MSARVLNPAMMTEISRNLGGGGGGGGGSGSGGGGGRAAPSRAALARVRRDLFGPVDHAAARALAERELRAQSLLDADRWGFNFQLGVPRSNSRYEWEPLTERDVVPEPYALRGMPYLRKHAPGTPRKLRFDETASTTVASSSSSSTSPSSPSTAATAAATTTTTTTTTSLTAMMATMTAMTSTRIAEQMETVVATPTAERTPPQEPRVPEIGEATTPNRHLDAEPKRKRCAMEPTTPVLPHAARKQSTITDYMKSRKRGLNGTKSMIEPPEKIARNAGQIRS
ncbi:cyclin-dependent kinase inhibitor dacapo [Temnothorax americanus]|uniref:cyclin-dependent kinase inhibitor dacapo n=1 Tax=Temnothorax americanus TaxID=1964332 RepID=UPI00406927C3